MERISTEGAMGLYVKNYIDSVNQIAQYDTFISKRIERLEKIMSDKTFNPEEAIFIINTINLKLKK